MLPYRFTAKELDEETGLYYYGARYLNPRTSRWISADPALENYVPVAPIDDEAKKHNQNLPGMGGVFNSVNLNLYHYAGNSPVINIDPTGEDQWLAHAVEISMGAYFAGGEGALNGKAFVGFENKDTGEYFTAEFTFTMTEVVGMAVTTVVTLSEGTTSGEFDPDITPIKLALTCGGDFSVFNVSAFNFSGSFITSENWTGWEGGVSPPFGSYGAGATLQTLNYDYIPGSISPVYDSYYDQQQAQIDEILYGE